MQPNLIPTYRSVFVPGRRPVWLVLVLSAAFVISAGAQIGSGWSSYTPNRGIQVETHGVYTEYSISKTHVAEAGASYDRVNGVETFKLFNHDASNRVEIRCHDEYSSGQRQFEGEVNVASTTTAKSVCQLFHIILIKAYSSNGGSLTGEKDANGTLATGIYGKWTRINMVHDASAHTAKIYINGTQKFSGSVSSGTIYHKYGIYGTLVNPTEQVQWRNVHFWKK
jgi:hypothetical protein